MLLSTLLALLPLAVLVLGMTWRNWPAWRSALPALAVLAVQAAVLGTPGLAGWARALADAVLLTGIVGYTLFFGLLLHEITARSGALDALLAALRGLGGSPATRLAWVLLVFAPAFESVSGFGLGVMIAVPMLARLGYDPARTLVLALISQLAVPWGALAIGMSLGAQMAHVPLPLLGAATSVLAVPGYAAFWAVALRIARPPGGWARGELVRAWLALAILALGVWVANRWATPELGGLGGTGLLAGWLWLTERTLGTKATRDAQPVTEAPSRHRVLAAAAPYGVLVALLGVTRFVVPLREWLAGHAVVSLPGSAFTLPLLYNPGAALAVACGVALLGFRGGPWAGSGGAVRGALRRWSAAAGAVFLLALLARGMVEAGQIAALSTAGGALPPFAARAAMAGLALLGGFLTGSVAGANALFVDLQVRMAEWLALPALWPLAAHQALAAAATAFSPARLVFAAVMTGQPGQEGAALRRLAPLVILLVLAGIAMLHPAVLGLLAAGRPWLTGG